MKKLFTLLFLTISLFVQSQNEQLAQNYFDRGEFEKAVISYEELLKINPIISIFFRRQLSVISNYNNLKKQKKHFKSDSINTNNLLC